MLLGEHRGCRTYPAGTRSGEGCEVGGQAPPSEQGLQQDKEPGFYLDHLLCGLFKTPWKSFLLETDVEKSSTDSISRNKQDAESIRYQGRIHAGSISSEDPSESLSLPMWSIGEGGGGDIF